MLAAGNTSVGRLLGGDDREPGAAGLGMLAGASAGAGNAAAVRLFRSAGDPAGAGAPAAAPAAAGPIGAGPIGAGPIGAGPIGFIPLDGRQISSDPDAATRQLVQIALAEGVQAARQVVLRLRLRRAELGLDQPPIAPEMASGMIAEAAANAAVIAALQAELQRWADFERAFEQSARTQAAGMLDLSEKRVSAERDHYGLTKTQDTMPTELGPVAFDVYGMAASPATTALATAAKQLLDALTPLQEATKKLDAIQVDESPGTWEFDTGLRPEAPDPAVLAAAREQVRATQERYLRLRNEKEIDFPVLASFAAYGFLHTYELKGVREKLETVGRGAAGGDQTAMLVSGDVFEKLENIAKVRAALADGSLNVWGADNLVGATRVGLGVAPGSLEDKIIDQKVSDDHSDRMLRDIFVGLFAMALGLIAAPLTGGGSLAVAAGVAATAGSAGLSAALAIEHVEQYQLDKAANATDFDKARVISSADPSLFWLALDVVLAGLDIAAAARAFAKLAPLARQAVRASEQGSKTALDALETAAEADAPALGRTVRQAAEHERGVAGAARPADLETATVIKPAPGEPSVVVDPSLGPVHETPGPGRPAPGRRSDVDWDDPNVRKALGLDPVTGKPTGAKLEGAGKLETDPAQRAFDKDIPAPGPYRGELGQVERGEYAAEGVFEVTKQPMFAVRVGSPGSWVDHLFATEAEARAYMQQVAAKGEAAIRDASALPHGWPKAGGGGAPGNAIDTVRILEVPPGTPTIRSVVAPQPESLPAVGRPAAYPGGGPQTQLPRNVFPRPQAGAGPSPAQVAEMPVGPGTGFQMEPPSSRLAQPGGLSATEGTRVTNAGGHVGPPAHPLERHGPDVTLTEVRNRVAVDGLGSSTKFTNRAQMEQAIADTLDKRGPDILSWLATNPAAGANKGFDYFPDLGNLGVGFKKVAGKPEAIQDTLESVRVVLKSTGNGQYIIQSAFPFHNVNL